MITACIAALFLSSSFHLYGEKLPNDILDVNCSNSIAEFKWAVVGAGPAGITTIGMLLDGGVQPETILWLDREFNVGRLGHYYTNIPGNTKTKLFVNFICCCDAFKACKDPSIDNLYTYDQEKECSLDAIIKPLQAITRMLCNKVKTLTSTLTSLHFDDTCWHISTPEKEISANHVVLATGSKPKRLDYSCKEEIPLDIALDQTQLRAIVNKQDIVVVVGSSHSAILLLKYLSEIPVQQVINLYSKPIQYATDMGTWILNNAVGLKGITAQWAKEILEKNPPINLIRFENTQVNREQALKQCTKIIYAIGYERNPLPKIKENPQLNYNDISGIIAPRLFGIGIAFPEKYTDPLGNQEFRVGISSFMEYAQRIVPEWLAQNTKKSIKKWDYLRKFDELININML